MTPNQIDNAIRIALHWNPRGITVHDVLLHNIYAKQPTREQVKARLVALAKDGKIEATPRGWVAVKRGADADPTSRKNVAERTQANDGLAREHA